MRDSEILEAAICKAKGYPYGVIIYPEVLQEKRYYTIIFDIKFAKAFWGEKKECFYCKGMENPRGTCPECFMNPKYRLNWQYHLQVMVLYEEPLKYLEKFLKKPKSKPFSY